jgi:hypothetical protein
LLVSGGNAADATFGVIVNRQILERQDTQISPARPKRVSPASRLLGAAVALTAGLLFAGTVSRSVGGVVVLASWAYFVVALHRYGRSGKSST